MPIRERFGVPFFAGSARRVMKHIYAPRPELKKRSIDKNKFYGFARRWSDRPRHGKQAGGAFGKAARRTRRE